MPVREDNSVYAVDTVPGEPDAGSLIKRFANINKHDTELTSSAAFESNDRTGVTA